MVQLFQVTLPNILQTIYIFGQGMVCNNQDIVVRDVTFLDAQFPVCLGLIVLPGITDIVTFRLFNDCGVSDLVMPSHLPPRESEGVAIAFHLVGNPFSQTFRRA